MSARPSDGADAQAQVAVMDDGADFRRGLEEALRAAGFSVVAPEELRGPGRGPGPRAVVASPEGDHAGALTQLRRDCPDLVVVEVLGTTDPSAYAEALARGAHAVVARNAPVDAIVQAVAVALDGMTVLPAGVARTLAARAAEPAAPVADREARAPEGRTLRHSRR
jgi:DNA-binding NarL/FixJ family response regulator